MEKHTGRRPLVTPVQMLLAEKRPVSSEIWQGLPRESVVVVKQALAGMLVQHLESRQDRGEEADE